MKKKTAVFDMTIREFLFKLTDTFKSAEIDGAEFEARNLIMHVLSLNNTYFLLKQGDKLSDEALNELALKAKRRLDGEPLQYILGSWDFMGEAYNVGRGVLIPRPETEELCLLALDKIKNKSTPVIYDLCSGSGCIGITLKNMCPQAEVYLVEKSADALFYLCDNVKNLCKSKNITVIKGDVFEFDKFNFLPEADFIVSNPPYIKKSEVPLLQREVQFEPEMALDGGDDGLDFYRFFIEKWSQKLAFSGEMLFEIGEDQGQEVKKLFIQNGFDCQIIKDYSGNDRIAVGRKSEL